MRGRKGDIDLIRLENGETVEAFSPIIVSASRATDIPAFHVNRFLQWLENGHLIWTNPFNNKQCYISLQRTRLFVFWSKNPRPLFDRFELIKKKKINSYIHYTINDYEKENLEPNLPSLMNRVDTFKRFVDRLGKGLVIWRFDPIILTDKIKSNDILEKMKMIGDQLKGYTEKLVISFVDIDCYRSVKCKMKAHNIKYKDIDENDIKYISRNLKILNNNWNYKISTCCENADLKFYGIEHNKCIDDELIARHFYFDQELMDFLGVETDLFGNSYIRRYKKDYGQRTNCGCVISKDIGFYDSCLHSCQYCYANKS